MNNRTCTMPDCNRVFRARGLCASHYNQAHQPDRHAKKMVACAWCGAEVLKGTGGGRKYGVSCSNECRSRLADRNPRVCKLPADHWALWDGKSSAWPRFGWKTCTVCTSAFPGKSTGQLYCSKSCGWKAENIRNGGMSVEQILAMVRACARCGEQYNSPHPGRIHCSDLCRDQAKADRGIPLFRGWIADSVRLSIYHRDDHTCWLCGDKVDYLADPQRDDWAPSLDHVLSRSKGGTHEADNLRTAHRWCNSVRSDNEQHDLFASA